MQIPPFFQRASEGFYQGALEYGGHSVEECVRLGVGMVSRSECVALVRWLDDLMVSPPEVVSEAWSSLRCEYDWDDPEFIRGILRSMRREAAERVSTGGGMPG